MKTKLHLLPAILAASVPVALAAEFAGLNLPTGLDTVGTVSALIATVFALTILGDYSRGPRSPLAPALARSAKADHPLAA
jgi:hypothetical protein